MRSIQIPEDYAERIYAGVLGKLIGVYLGRPIEGWTYDQILETHGEVDHYLPGRDNAPLVVTDDDITGTFTFLRALADNGYPDEITSQQIANAWLNYAIERRTIFWWGGVGNSTEHTAYVRLKSGVPAPESGSKALNGKVVSEQIGAQIFIDGWGMVCPGDPERAADLARRAASVSHDGEAVYGAQVIAAMEAQAFVELDLNALLDQALTFIPGDSVIARVIHDVRFWHAREADWRHARELIVENYGYDKFLGPCHMVPNHALVIHALLHGDGDFRRSLMIVNTSGWDTDCNSGNVGCLLGIRNGLEALDGDYDWRSPVADRLYLPTADGGRAITDAVTETYHVVNAGRALAGLEPVSPKGGARFHFELPGSLQGFQIEGATDIGQAALSNVEGHSARGRRSLRIRLPESDREPIIVWTPTFIPPDAFGMPGYELLASPTLHPGQKVLIRIETDWLNTGDVSIAPVFRFYDGTDSAGTFLELGCQMRPGSSEEFVVEVPRVSESPIWGVGVQLHSNGGAAYLDYLDWSGAPVVAFERPEGGGTLWRQAWVNGVDQFDDRWPEPFRIVQNRGTGLISQGTSDWKNYVVEAPVTIFLAKSGGIAARVQGLRRYYALLLCDDQTARLVKARGTVEALATKPFAWQTYEQHNLALEVHDRELRGWVDGELCFAEVDDVPLPGGGVGLVVEEGCLSIGAVRISPVRT